MAAILYGCSSNQPLNTPPPALAPEPAHVTGRPQVVLASWYGAGFNGHVTSSGEKFGQHRYTAASRTLPLGSHARVTNLSNGRSVVVRINDRGPFVRGRGIDLSRGAAHEIGLDRRGVGRVQVSRIDGPSGPDRKSWAGPVKLTETASHRRRHVTPVSYPRSTRNSTTDAATMVSNPIGAWLVELVSPARSR